jgi:hypothetical protein
MGYGRNFYGNICRLLSGINNGICHRRSSVKVPLSKVWEMQSRCMQDFSAFHVSQHSSCAAEHV